MTDLNEIKRDVRIVDYAGELGLHPKRIGRYYTLKEHDSVRIDPEKNIFIRNSTGVGGSVIDFAMCFAGISFKAAVRELSGRHNNVKTPVEKATETTSSKSKSKAGIFALELPKKDRHMRNVFAYLVKTRKIDQKIVQDMVNRDALYQDVHKNCVFVSREESGKPVFASVRGTNTYKKFMADVFGCDYSRGLFLSNKANRLIITESAIDGMSVMNLLLLQGKDYMTYDYLALSGSQKGAMIMENHLQKYSYTDIYLCLDNDIGGKVGVKQLVEAIGKKSEAEVHIALPKDAKDYNLVLKGIKEKALLKDEEFEL